MDPPTYEDSYKDQPAEEEEQPAPNEDEKWMDVTPLPIELPSGDIEHRSQLISPGYKRCVIAGASKSGKTYRLRELLPMLAEFQTLTIYTKTAEQPVYQFLRDYYTGQDVDVNIITDRPPDIDELFTWQDAFKANEHNIIIIDDLKSSEINKNVLPFFSKCRHLHASVILIHQNYFSILKDIRDQVNLLMLFKTTDGNAELWRAVKGYFEDHDEFAKTISHIYKKPFNFLLIDADAPPSMRVREGFSGIMAKYIP